MPSISVSKGEGSLNHNNRKFKTANVDPSRTHLNIILKKPCQKVLQNAYHELFDNALQKYNGRQKRDDRKIKNYLSHIPVSYTHLDVYKRQLIYRTQTKKSRFTR